MTRYIDADAVKDCIEKEVYTHDYIEHVYQIIDDAPTADVVEVVYCKDCKWYEPAHILHDDGSKTYVDENAPLVTADVGINVGGQCIDHSGLKISCVNHNREDLEDYEEIVIFRRPNEYCSCGERRE